jgi:hypothetical protein
VIYVGGHSGTIHAVNPDGTIFTYADFKYHAIKGSSPLAGSSWPTMGGSNSGSGRISDY